MILTGLAAASSAMSVAAAFDPVAPDGDDARRWAEQELSDPVYAEAQPTALDRVAEAIGRFFSDLFRTDVGDGWGSALAVIATIVVVVLIVVAFLIWGRPRITPRSRAGASDLFGEDDRRSADELRRDAASRAAAGDWTPAIILRFRALARAVDERGVVDNPPGATVHAFARAAGRAFPEHRAALDEAAAAFDDVRYLRRPGTAALYVRVGDVDDAVSAARPVPPRLSSAGAPA
ncbi:DUF4129 domain-containing protein [Microbacterium sp. P01]|uniref:DUF4129 domain-containing protein n=1 Tax=Microbacterium sp. P01 TaxID=3366261 RepID=UPI003671CBA3